MDENKNWINYKKYDYYAEFEFVAMATAPDTKLEYRFPQDGLYLYIHSGSSITSISTSALQTSLIYSEAAGTNNSMSLIYFNAKENDTMISAFGTYHQCSGALYFLTNKYSNLSIVTKQVGGNSFTATLSFENKVNRVLIATGSGDNLSAANINTSTTSRQYYASKRHACISTIDEEGSASISAFGFMTSGLQVVFDLQVF